MHAESRDAESRFYRGVICKLFFGSRSGVLRSESGRELPFFETSLRINRGGGKFEDLREGMVVGFDVGRTPMGLQVTVMHVARRGE